MLAALWRGFDVGDATVTLFGLQNGKNPRSAHIPIASLPEWDESDDRYVAEWNKTHDLYFGLGARRAGLSETKQGSQRDVVWLPGFAIDIDFANPKAHKALYLPRDLDEASQIFDNAPEPSLVVLSGHGAHVYWLLDKPLRTDCATSRRNVTEAYRKLFKRFAKRARGFGWQLDSTATIQRVWRLPGTINHKTGARVSLFYEGPRHSLADLGLSVVPAPSKRTRVAESEPVRAPAKASPRGASELVAKMRERLRTVSPENQFHTYIQRLLADESFADPGKREHALYGIATTLVWFPEGHRADPYELAEIFRPSFEIWAEEDDDAKTVEEELERAVARIERAQADWYEKNGKGADLLAGLAEATGEDLEEELDEEELKRRLILGFAPSFFAWSFKEQTYSRPLQAIEVGMFVSEHWEDAPPGITPWRITKDGDRTRKETKTLLTDYGQVIDRVVVSMSSKTRFDASTKTLYRALYSPKPITPRYHPEIDEWLRLLAGDNYEKLCDWIAAVPVLEHPTCALYLQGPPGTGKGLFVEGLSYRWGGASPLLDALGSFNDALKNSPILWCDEGLPPDMKVSNQLREIIAGSSSFVLREKYKAPSPIEGNFRLIITANNADAIRFPEGVSNDDVEAVAARILHIPTQQIAADWLREKGGREFVESWVNGGIAAHCAWLAENREWVRGERFLVEGASTDYHRGLHTQSDPDNLVYEFLVRYASAPETIDRVETSTGADRIFLGEGSLHVNAQAVVDHWELHLDGRPIPSTRRIASAIAKITKRQSRPRTGGKRVRLWAVDVSFLSFWSQKYGVGDPEILERNVHRENEAIRAFAH